MDILYKDLEHEFYEYLKLQFGDKSRTKTNYISWLRFLSNEYLIDSNLSESKIENIIQEEYDKRNHREKYKREKDVSDFRSALRKYMEFLKYPFLEEKQKIIDSKIEEIKTDRKITTTEKKNLILSRIGQGKYKKDLIEYWKGCSLLKYSQINFLVASHIKPWKDSTNEERLDKFNGLLLLPNQDRLFDRGYISFNKNGKIILSDILTQEDKAILGINENYKLIKFENNHKNYLEFHRDLIFIK
jgi:putative restriction endonuclease